MFVSVEPELVDFNVTVTVNEVALVVGGVGISMTRTLFVIVIDKV